VPRRSSCPAIVTVVLSAKSSVRDRGGSVVRTMIPKVLHAYGMRNLPQGKSLRDHGAAWVQTAPGGIALQAQSARCWRIARIAASGQGHRLPARAPASPHLPSPSASPADVMGEETLRAGGRCPSARTLGYSVSRRVTSTPPMVLAIKL